MSARIHEGDALAVLRTLDAESVQCCVTSPPYWGLRDYGHEGQIGLERTPAEYVARMVEVFREVRRVLRSDGTLWLNLGDSYCSTDKWGGGGGNTGKQTVSVDGSVPSWAVRAKKETIPGLKPKDLVGIPWRVAFALQADGWWLRQEIIWHKPNPMPESVTDRCTKAHEQVFLLTKSERYAYDADAIAEPSINAGRVVAYDASTKNASAKGSHGRDTLIASDRVVTDTRNRRSVWTIPSQPFPGSHFAVMPEALAEPCVLAGSAIGTTVLDPFTGSGTVGVVALKYGRHFVGIELNPAYAAMARERIRGDAPLLNRVAR